MTIAYAAHTAGCIFLLDDEGICQKVVHRGGRVNGMRTPGMELAERCIGAQYVASIDPGENGGLAKLPRSGKPLVFAFVTMEGRIALVRTGPLVMFETRAVHDSGLRYLPTADYPDEREELTVPVLENETMQAPAQTEDEWEEPTVPTQGDGVDTVPRVFAQQPQARATALSTITPDRHLPAAPPPRVPRMEPRKASWLPAPPGSRPMPPPVPPAPRSSPTRVPAARPSVVPPPLIRKATPPPVLRRVTVVRPPDSSTGPTERRPVPGGEWRIVPRGILPKRASMSGVS